jgi:hypothetical protein
MTFKHEGEEINNGENYIIKSLIIYSLFVITGVTNAGR